MKAVIIPIRIRRGCLASIILIFSISTSFSQQLLNLDFEKLSVEGLARPWGWTVYSYAPNTTFVCDTSTVFSGKHSFKVANNSSDNKGRFELTFFVEPNQILNSKITLEGWVKGENFIGSSGINLKSIGSIGEEFGILNEGESEIEITKDWKRHKTEINIDSRPHSVLVTLYFEGNGTVWFDKLQLKINGENLIQIPVAPKFTKEQEEWISSESVPFKTVEPELKADLSESDFSDLEYFKSMIGDAQIIALGESTHGTSEFFKLKHRLLQYVILELGVRVFILEDNQLIVERINNFVLYGEGEASTKGLFAVWSTQEMLQLIKWIRLYNIAHPNQMVEFVGMDVQNPELALDYLSDFLKIKDTLLHNRSTLLLKGIKEDWRNSYFKTDSTLIQWDQKGKTNYNLILSHKNEWLMEAQNKSDSLKIEQVIQYARTIKQYTETTLTGVYEGRDKSMAENVEWIVNQRKKGTKVIIWAHDSHVSRGDHPKATSNFFLGNSMGSYLSKKYNNKYRAFGLSTYQGMCLGTISYSDFTQMPFEIYTSPTGSLDEALHNVSLELNKPSLMLNLQPFKNDLSKFKWMNIKRPARYVGYVAEDYGFGGRYAIPFQFDGIIFIDSSTASKKIK